MPIPVSARRLVPLLALPIVLAAACSSSGTKTTSAPGATSASGAGATATTAGAPAVVKTASSSLGTILVDTSTGHTLYYNDKEQGGTIVCTDGCATAWPPLTVASAPAGSAGGGTLGVVSRPDGTQQLTWNGKPMYHFVQDTAAGDTKGNGLGGVWHAVVVSAGASTATTAASGAYGGY